jgi:5-methyltetrahydropteroyltriglutamate--homocysteine methyltransferase
MISHFSTLGAFDGVSDVALPSAVNLQKLGRTMAFIYAPIHRSTRLRIDSACLLRLIVWVTLLSEGSALVRRAICLRCEYLERLPAHVAMTTQYFDPRWKLPKKIYRADQVGSLLRPARLLDARDAFAAGEIDRSALRREEDAAVADVLLQQQGIGMPIFTDGEMRRDAWQTVFSQAVGGFVDQYPIMAIERPDGSKINVQMHTKTVRGKLCALGRLAQDDAMFLKDHAPGPFKVTLPSPANIARGSFRPGVTNSAIYPDRHALLRDTTVIVRDEMKALVEDGASYIQLDEGFTYHLTATDSKDVATAERDLARDIAAENECHDAVRSEAVTVAIHICRGSRVAWTHGLGGYDWLAERLFDALRVDRFVLEYDTASLGGFEPLRFLPKGKVVVLGLVSSKEPRLESRDELLRRIDAAAKFCSVDQLALTSQCGFQGSATRDGAHLDLDTQWRKLERIVETAREVWG